MQEENRGKQKSFDNEIDLRELFHVLFKGKWIIVSITAFTSIIGVIYSLTLPNLYTSKALLAPTNTSNGISRAFAGYSGLAGLAGINLPSGSDEGNHMKAMQKISSLSFFENNILKNIYLPDLMAVKGWDSKTNTLTYDRSIYDIKRDIWFNSNQGKPSAQESFIVFKSKHLGLSEDKKSGFVTLSTTHQSPFIARQWTELAINEVNSFYRQKDKSESEKAVSYLNQQISVTALSEIKQVLAQLLQEETKKLALIEANQSYVFEYIDPPAIMEKKSGPKRAFICTLMSIFGLIIGVILVLLRYYSGNKKNHDFSN